jgi:DNA recombination protein RmuC
MPEPCWGRAPAGAEPAAAGAAAGLLLRAAPADAHRDAAPLIARWSASCATSAAARAQGCAATLGLFQQMLLAQSGDVARTQNEQIDAFRVQLARHAAAAGRSRAAAAARRPSSCARCPRPTSAAWPRCARPWSAAGALQEGNEKKLEQMRATVDEKLHATLEQRLGESFKQVAERLEQVHKGLGEMQTLARDVGSLNRVLTNVKTRGIFGEVQLAGLLEQVFTPEQYAANVATVPGSNERVEFALRLPGPAQRRRAAVAAHRRQVPARGLRAPARRPGARRRRRPPRPRPRRSRRGCGWRRAASATSTWRRRTPPTSRILFVPTEGLYAEALRRPGLLEALQREHKVMLAGPTTLLATLNSLQMGFRTLALEKRSAEVWEVLGAVKTEFGKFGDVLAKTRKKLDEASNTIDAAEVRTRAMARQLNTWRRCPSPRARAAARLADRRRRRQRRGADR